MTLLVQYTTSPRNFNSIRNGWYSLSSTMPPLKIDDYTFRNALTADRLLQSNSKHDLDKYLSDLHQDEIDTLYDAQPPDLPSPDSNPKDLCKELDRLILLNSNTKLLCNYIKCLTKRVAVERRE